MKSRCLECGEEIDPYAVQCIHCGLDFSDDFIDQEVILEEEYKTAITRKTNIRVVLLLIQLTIAISYLACLGIKHALGDRPTSYALMTAISIIGIAGGAFLIRAHLKKSSEINHEDEYQLHKAMRTEQITREHVRTFAFTTLACFSMMLLLLYIATFFLGPAFSVIIIDCIAGALMLSFAISVLVVIRKWRQNKFNKHSKESQ